MKNTGKPAERLVLEIAGAYERRGVLRMRKVDPPSAWTKRGVVLTDNPFPDFVGSWTRMGGRMIACEVKSTSEPKLVLGKGGITDGQAKLLTQWMESGAAVFVLWVYGSDMAFIPWGWIMRRPSGARRHIKWMEAGCMTLCKDGLGYTIHDFEREMQLAFREEK